MAVEADLIRFAYEKLYGILAEFDQAAGIKQGVGIALKSAGVPGQVDQ
jgi:hypothetical protein